MKTDQINNQELEKVGIMIPINKNQAFKVPDGYFENFSADLMNNISTTTFIENLPKNEPQSIPNGYFENFYTQLSPKIFDNQPKTQLKVSYKRFSYRLAMAASMTLIFTIGFLMMNQPKKSTIEQELAKIPTEEINQYIEDNSEEFAAVLSKENVNINNIDFDELEKELFETNDIDKQSKILNIL